MAEIFLDTHVVAWLHAGERKRFPGRVWRLLEREALLISGAVILELQLLHEIGRTSQPGLAVVDDLRRRIGLDTAESVFPAVASVAAQLAWTRDPFDRLIVANASLASARLVTKDDHIREHYARAFWD